MRCDGRHISPIFFNLGKRPRADDFDSGHVVVAEMDPDLCRLFPPSVDALADVKPVDLERRPQRNDISPTKPDPCQEASHEHGCELQDTHDPTPVLRPRALLEEHAGYLGVRLTFGVT